MFHFNKAHLFDSRIAPWVIKTKGITYYVKHVDVNAPFSTKETPDNPHTKGSLKFRNIDIVIDNEIATISPSENKIEDFTEIPVGPREGVIAL